MKEQKIFWMGGWKFEPAVIRNFEVVLVQLLLRLKTGNTAVSKVTEDLPALLNAYALLAIYIILCNLGEIGL